MPKAIDPICPNCGTEHSNLREELGCPGFAPDEWGNIVPLEKLKKPMPSSSEVYDKAAKTQTDFEVDHNLVWQSLRLALVAVAVVVALSLIFGK